jgi:hypothetical protein
MVIAQGLYKLHEVFALSMMVRVKTCCEGRWRTASTYCKPMSVLLEYCDGILLCPGKTYSTGHTETLLDSSTELGSCD